MVKKDHDVKNAVERCAPSGVLTRTLAEMLKTLLSFGVRVTENRLVFWLSACLINIAHVTKKSEGFYSISLY